MKIFSMVCLFILAVIPSYGQTGQVKRALDNIQSGDFTRALELLIKAQEKEPADPAVKYGWSVLFEAREYPNANIDTAYYFIIQARRTFDSLDEKSAEKLSRNGFDLATFDKHKTLLDSLSFQKARAENTISSYTAFILKHASASQLDEAIALRQIVAFDRAENEGTYKAYEIFLRNYPKAPQIPEARKRYEKLFYESITSDGRLSSFLTYLKEKPESSFRQQVEQRIFELSTVGNQKSDYLEFIRLSKIQEVSNRARGFLFHIIREDSLVKWENETWMTDSLYKELNTDRQKLLPIYEKWGYNFVNQEGELIFNQYLETLSADYLCEIIDTDVLLLPEGDKNMIAQRNGRSIYTENILHIEDLGYGIIKAETHEGVGAIHKGGERVVPFSYDNIRLINGAYLAAQSNKNWGLFSFTGVKILPMIYDSIISINQSYLILFEDKWAITSSNELNKSADGEKPNLVFIYDEFESWNDESLWVRSGSKEALIDNRSGFSISLEEQVIDPAANGFLVKKENSVTYLDNSLNPILDDCSNIRTNTAFVKAFSKGQWYLINNSNNEQAVYDSIKLWGRHYAVTKSSEGLSVNAPNGKQLALQENDHLELITANRETEYILIESEKGVTRLFDAQGKTILEGDYEDISALGEEYILYKQNGNTGLASSEGAILLKARYDAIAGYNKGGVSLLLRGMLGYYHMNDTVYIKPEYRKKVTKGAKGQWIAGDDSGYFIINKSSKKVFDTSWDQLSVWNDSSYLAFDGDEYKIIDAYQGKVLKQGILELQTINAGSISEDKHMKIKTSKGYGVYSTRQGVIIEPEFSFIYQKDDFYIAERFFDSADFYTIIYFTLNGKNVWSGGLSTEEYSQLYCEN